MTAYLAVIAFILVATNRGWQTMPPWQHYLVLALVVVISTAWLWDEVTSLLNRQEDPE